MMEFFNTILFEMGGRPVLLIDLLSALFGLTTVFLAGRNNKYNFYVGYMYTALLFFMFWQKNLYANLILQPISLGINIMGQYRWSHPKKSEESSSGNGELKVSMLTWPQRGLIVGLVLTLALVWGWLMSMMGTRWFVGYFPANPLPYLDCCVTVLILAAQLLSALKKWDCWIAWLFVNIANLTLYLKAGLVFMPIVSCLYLINGIWSLFTWYRLYRKNA
jgi:nicotinamide mononucleotide transporter